jgi:hypothetical protein
MPRRRVSIQWQPGRDRTAESTRSVAVERVPAPVSARPSISRILEQVGTPEVVGATTPKEEAIGLLQLAAEIEHSLMVQYLYAAASLPPGGTGGVNGRTKILSVAVQEMGHLISVQNLLLLVGGPDALHFGRDGIRAASPGNPIPLVLEPISSDALAKFVVAEMPADIPDPALRQRVDELVEIAKTAAHATPHRVGALYAKLFWLFQADDAPIAPYDLSPSASVGLKAGWHLDPKEFTEPSVITQTEATRGDWVKGSVTGFILSSVSTASAARDLISAISEQGEGLGVAHDSHFFAFLELLDALEGGQLQTIVLPVNPVARVAPAPDAGTSAAILTPYAKLWAELLDGRYTLLLLDLWHGLATPMASPTRKALIGLAYANMDFVWEIIEQLLLIRDMVGVTDAAPPFGLQFEDLPEAETQRWRRHQRLLASQAEIVEAIRSSPEFQDPSTGEILDFDGSIRLGNIEQSDVVRRTLIQSDLST